MVEAAVALSLCVALVGWVVRGVRRSADLGRRADARLVVRLSVDNAASRFESADPSDWSDLAAAWSDPAIAVDVRRFEPDGDRPGGYRVVVRHADPETPFESSPAGPVAVRWGLDR